MKDKIINFFKSPTLVLILFLTAMLAVLWAYGSGRKNNYPGGDVRKEITAETTSAAVTTVITAMKTTSAPTNMTVTSFTTSTTSVTSTSASTTTQTTTTTEPETETEPDITLRVSRYLLICMLEFLRTALFIRNVWQ